LKTLDDTIYQRDCATAWLQLRSQAWVCDDYTELTVLSRKMKQLEESAGLPSDLIPVKIAVLGGATIDFLAEPLRLMLIAAGVSPDFHFSGFNQWVTEMLDEHSQTTAFAPAVTVVVNTPFNLPLWPDLDVSLTGTAKLIEQACDFFLKPCKSLHDRTGCEIVFNNLHPLPARELGNLGAKLPGDPNNFIRRFNIGLGDRAPSYVHINDVAAMAERRGLEQWFDLRHWHLAKQPVSFDCLAEYARNTASIVAALFGRMKKCLILDLDNTVWGGLVGEEGLEGIELGEGSPLGEAYKAFQTYLRRLRQRGILLAVCSKNDAEMARLPFVKRPEMVLKLEDFVSFKANWLPKSDNVRAIAEEIGIGLDACVFLDDSPAERKLVRHALPEVSVPELTDDPADYPGILDSHRYFEAVAVTADDRHRTESYRQRTVALELRPSVGNLSEYLASLKMKASLRPFDDVSLERITQLINKTNQFNLTTPRLAFSQVKAIAADPSYLTREVRLKDCFGDQGLISAFFARIYGREMTIEAWLMSCRVLNRGVEQMLFNEVVCAARQLGVAEVIGIYSATDRNRIVQNHYRDLGFSPDGEKEGKAFWRLRVDNARLLQCRIEVERSECSANSRSGIG
jgi:FkbH-like protein